MHTVKCRVLNAHTKLSALTDKPGFNSREQRLSYCHSSERVRMLTAVDCIASESLELLLQLLTRVIKKKIIK